jgi:hypothetical protein
LAGAIVAARQELSLLEACVLLETIDVGEDRPSPAIDRRITRRLAIRRASKRGIGSRKAAGGTA